MPALFKKGLQNAKNWYIINKIVYSFPFPIMANPAKAGDAKLRV